MSVMTSSRNSAPAGEQSTTPWSRAELPDSGLPTVTAITDSLREIDSVSREFERRLGSVLTVNQTDLSAMEYLIQQGPVTPSALAAHLKVSTAASTLVVDRLVALGHAERHPHEHDRRKIVVVPTRGSVGRAVQELMPVIMGINEVVQSLPEGDRAVIEHFLERVIGVYRAAVDAPRSV